jgi:uncharacterized membrane-anchored protein
MLNFTDREVVNIRTRKVILLSWTAMLISNTFSTALRDFIADDSGLGFIGGASIIGGVLAELGAFDCLTPFSRVALFWLAFILTRTFGAMFSDLLTKPLDKSGLNLGKIEPSLVLAAILGTLIIPSLRQQRNKKTAVALSAIFAEVSKP